jgi:nucleotide-binding universal stress UspA family protein
VQPEASWTLQCFAADPGPLLRRHSELADPLVVGTGEHVGPGRLMVGSVSHYWLRNARCPVVAVPAPQVPAKAAAKVDPLPLSVSETI